MYENSAELAENKLHLQFFLQDKSCYLTSNCPSLPLSPLVINKILIAVIKISRIYFHYNTNTS